MHVKDGGDRSTPEKDSRGKDTLSKQHLTTHPEGALLPWAEAQAADRRRPRRQPVQLHVAERLVEAQRQRLAPGVTHSFTFSTVWVACPGGQHRTEATSDCHYLIYMDCPTAQKAQCHVHDLK